ncbi:MAG TPA: hypothetical protein VK618_11670 [Flavitalea sp.]|nr:hypothetical protein [Flavitalea sp.]
MLITTDEVIFHASMDHQVDPRIILQSIIIAERRLVKPVIGATLYDQLIEAKNKVVTSANKAGLETDLNAGRGSNRDAIVLQEGDLVNSDSYLSAAQQFLWTEHLHKITAECVYYVALPVNRARFTAKGVEKNNPDNIGSSSGSTSIGMGELKYLMDKTMFTRMNPLVEDMINYLVSVRFSGFDLQTTQPIRGRTGISLNMYDDDDEKGCSWN